MQIGIFAKTFSRDSLAATLDAVTGAGLHHVQFNLSCAGLSPLPESMPEGLPKTIRLAHESRKISMAAVSGTFNMAHPNPDVRKEGLRCFRVLAAACKPMGTELITLCTGSRDPENMWRKHPENTSEAAWNDMRTCVAKAIEVAEAHDLFLGVEPEVSNIVDSAKKARQLLDEIRSPRLRIVMDGANLFHDGELSRMQDVLSEAFELLGSDIALAHAKDLTRDGAAGDAAAGTGLLDYDAYIRLLRRVGYTGPLILHGLTEAQVPESVAFLRAALQRGDLARKAAQ